MHQLLEFNGVRACYFFLYAIAYVWVARWQEAEYIGYRNESLEVSKSGTEELMTHGCWKSDNFTLTDRKALLEITLDWSHKLSSTK